MNVVNNLFIIRLLAAIPTKNECLQWDTNLAADVSWLIILGGSITLFYFIFATWRWGRNWKTATFWKRLILSLIVGIGIQAILIGLRFFFFLRSYPEYSECASIAFGAKGILWGYIGPDKSIIGQLITVFAVSFLFTFLWSMGIALFWWIMNRFFLGMYTQVLRKVER